MKCQFCGKEIEGEPQNKIMYILAKEHYDPTFFLTFSVAIKAHGGREKAQLCEHCFKYLYEQLVNAFKED